MNRRGWLPRRSRIAACLLVCVAMLPAAAVAAADEEGALAAGRQLLAKSDDIRNPGKSFKVDIELFEYRSGVAADRMALRVFVRAEPGEERFGNIVRFETPAQDVGKLMLFQGRDLWFYDPASRASFRLSPQQRLVGQASNGDVLAVRLASDYHARVAGRVTIIDAEKAERHCELLELSAATPQAVYHRIEYWQDADTAVPVKARFYSESGQLLKTAFYRKLQLHLGRMRPSEVLIIDGLNSKLVTVMRYSNYAYRDVPATWLQRDYLPRFQVQ